MTRRFPWKTSSTSDQLVAVVLGQRQRELANFFSDFHADSRRGKQTEWSHLPHSSRAEYMSAVTGSKCRWGRGLRRPARVGQGRDLSPCGSVRVGPDDRLEARGQGLARRALGTRARRRRADLGEALGRHLVRQIGGGVPRRVVEVDDVDGRDAGVEQRQVIVEDRPPRAPRSKLRGAGRVRRVERPSPRGSTRAHASCLPDESRDRDRPTMSNTNAAVIGDGVLGLGFTRAAYPRAPRQ